MDIIARRDTEYVLSFARGEDLVEKLLSWLVENDIPGATLTGLGAADRLELGYYRLPGKTYERHVVNEEVEVVSLLGNLGTLKGEKMLHIHGVFGRSDLSSFGGHVFKLRVSGACEIHLTAFPLPFNRSFDEETGLNLLRP